MSAAEQSDGWIEWDGDAATIPDGRGWLQFTHETREEALRRPADEIQFWPWFSDYRKPCVKACRVIEP